ncbi:unnamed protein product [Allacma fusca]|uniref:Uncharacterized protein n=1 Tax=Allacma fusca TaxID=39272 RepID=A0A8J2LGE6_9HEXA|nr:unnamed protein product [Allacma fusca]
MFRRKPFFAVRREHYLPDLHVVFTGIRTPFSLHLVPSLVVPYRHFPEIEGIPWRLNQNIFRVCYDDDGDGSVCVWVDDMARPWWLDRFLIASIFYFVAGVDAVWIETVGRQWSPEGMSPA